MVSDKAKTWMNKAMHQMMLSCDTARLYITKKEYQKLSSEKKVEIEDALQNSK